MKYWKRLMEITASKDCAIYTRRSPTDAWEFEYKACLEIGLLQREVNRGFKVDTLIVPFPMVGQAVMNVLDPTRTQADFPGVPQMDHAKQQRLRRAQLIAAYRSACFDPENPTT